ncbi:MAG: nitrate ABC transporter permease [Sulfuriferula sp.]
MIKSLNFRALIVTATLLVVLLFAWNLATQPKTAAIANVSPEYAALMGGNSVKKSGMPTPLEFWHTVRDQLSNPFYDHGPNDKGIGIQLGYSLARVLSGFALAALLAIPLGFLLGMSPVMQRAFNPFIQLLKPISPLAWMPLALYTIKDASASAIFVIFICSLWPMLINTTYGVGAVKREWLNVAKTLEVSTLRKAFLVVLPAAAPTILIGMRISMGIAWLVIVAAEMLVGGTGIGYFVWNEWNNLSLTNVIFAILMIGVVGMSLDMIFSWLSRLVAYND